MTEQLIECDDRMLLAVLRSGDEELKQPLARHVEECVHCQTRLAELAATEERWQKAAAAFSDGDQRLQPIESDVSPQEINRWTARSISWNEAMVRQLLDAPSHPEMLGRLGRYEIERLVGSGGMGIVFKAHDTELNRPVAIKMLAPYLASSGSARKRFAREARSAAGIVDDHVVPIHNVESDSDHPFLVMQYVAGGSLQEKLDRCGPLGVAEIVRTGLQAAKGLAAAHAQGLIHRDVKPSNILLDEGVERALLTDFGLARTEDDACLTRSGFQPGTPHYMSPEQVRGESIDGRSDLFGLGCVLYALCTGRPPFRAESGYAVMRRITDDTPRSIREVNEHIPGWLEQIVMKLLSKSRDDRFESAEELVRLLAGCLAHVQEPTSTPLPESVAASPPRRGGRFRSLKYLAFTAFVFLILAGTFIYLESSKGTIRIESNSNADVPIVIRQGQEEVEQLTVSRTGARLRLSAGKYEIEVDGADADLTITGDQVELTRGGEWIARIIQTNKTSLQDRHETRSAHDSLNQTQSDESHQYLVWEPENQVRLSHWFARSLQLDDAKVAAVNQLLSQTWSKYITFERQHTTFTRTAEGRLLVSVGYPSNTEDGKAFAVKQRQFDNEFWTKLDKIVSGEQRESLHALSTMRGDGNGDDTWPTSLKGAKGRARAYPSLLGWKADWYPVNVEIWKKGTWFHHRVMAQSESKRSSGDGQTLPPELAHYWYGNSDDVEIHLFTRDWAAETDVPDSETTGVRVPADSASPIDQLHGSWRAIKTTDETVLLKSLTFYRDRVGLLANESAAEGIVVLPETDVNEAIDFVWYLPNKNPMPISRGLYEIRDGVLWLRMAADGKPRPTDLETDQPGTTFQKFTREWIRSDLPEFDPSKTLELQRWAGNRKGAGVATTYSLFVPGRDSLLEANNVHAPMAPTYELADVPGFDETTFTVQLFLPNLSPRGMEFLARNSITMTAWPSEFMAARESKRVVKAFYLPDAAAELKASSVEQATLTNTQSQAEWLRDLDRNGDVLVVYELARGHLPNFESRDNAGPNADSITDDSQPSGSSPADDRNRDGYVRGNGKVVALVPREQQQSVKSPVPDPSDLAVELWISGNDAPLVQQGDPVRLQFEGWPNEESTGSFRGKVMTIDPTADGEGRFRVLVKADDKDSWPDERSLRPGVRATGWILTGDRSNIESRSDTQSPAAPISESIKSAFASPDENSKTNADSENLAERSVQVYFRGPSKVKLTLERDPNLSVVAPGRLRIKSGEVYGLLLSNITAQPNDPLRNDPSLGDRFDLLAGWLELAAVNSQTAAYLKDNDILLDFTDDEIAEVQARGILTKVIYLTRADGSKPRKLKILSQTLFELGDGDAPINKAKLDGDILAVLRLGESVYYDNGHGARLRRKKILIGDFESDLQALHNLRVGRKPTIEETTVIVERLLSRYPERKATIHGQAAHLLGQSGIKQFSDQIRSHARASLETETDIVERARMLMYLSNAEEVSGEPSEANYWALRGLLELQPLNLPAVAPDPPGVGRFNDLVADPTGDTNYGTKQKLYQRLSAAEQQARDSAIRVRELVQFRDIYVDILRRINTTAEACTRLQALERERIGSRWLQEFVKALFASDAKDETAVDRKSDDATP
ncbi:MAG: protein kinase [Fuerstiella sp.]